MKNSKKLNKTNLYSEGRCRLKELQDVQKEKIKVLSDAPEGKIHVIMNKGRAQFYLRSNSNEKGGKYISKKEYPKIKTHLQKVYDQKVLNLIDEEIELIKTFLNKSESIHNQIESIYSNYPTEIRNYINPVTKHTQDDIEAWLKTPYKGLEIFSENTYESNKGDIVRSKTELNIANLLFQYGIPYKYECPLRLANGNVIYPDFTIYDIKHGRIVYWEHRGMMDDRGYARDSVVKIKDYMKSGIMLGDNLIITEETSIAMLDTADIKAIIKHYFL